VRGVIILGEKGRKETIHFFATNGDHPTPFFGCGFVEEKKTTRPEESPLGHIQKGNNAPAIV